MFSSLEQLADLSPNVVDDNINLNMFTDFTEGSVYCDYINLDVDSSHFEKPLLIDHILRCSKTKQHLNELRWNVEKRQLTLPKTNIWKEHYHKIVTGKLRYNDKWNEEYMKGMLYTNDPKNHYVNTGDLRFFSIEIRTHLCNNIVLLTEFGLPFISVEEVNEIKECVQSYIPVDIKTQNYDHYNNNNKWENDAIDQLTDPITLKLFVKPVIASDGMTYSEESLINIFRMTPPISPMTREPLRAIGSYKFGKQEPGIPNKLIEQLLEKFINGRMKTSSS